MTEAEKMREAAADWCADEADRCEDAAKWGGHRKYVQDCKAAAYALRNAWSKIRALPVDASAQAADCHQAGLVTVDAGLLDEVKGILCVAKDEINAMPTHINLRNVERLINAALARLEREVG